MPEADATPTKNYYEDVPVQTPGFFLKGAGSLDWGMKNRLARIFRPSSRAHRDAGRRPRLLPGAHHRPGAPRPGDPAAAAARRRPDGDPRGHPHQRDRGHRQARRRARQRRPQRAAGALRRAPGDEHRGRGAAQRLGAGRAGLHRQRERDASRSRTSPPSSTQGQQRRHPGDGRGGGGQGDGARRAATSASPPASWRSSAPRSSSATTSPRASAPSSAACPVPLVVAGGKKLPEREALQMTLQLHRRGRPGRGHGPQHLPERGSRGHDPGRLRHRPRRRVRRRTRSSSTASAAPHERGVRGRSAVVTGAAGGIGLACGRGPYGAGGARASASTSPRPW